VTGGIIFVVEAGAFITGVVGFVTGGIVFVAEAGAFVAEAVGVLFVVGMITSNARLKGGRMGVFERFSMGTTSGVVSNTSFEFLSYLRGFGSTGGVAVLGAAAVFGVEFPLRLVL